MLTFQVESNIEDALDEMTKPTRRNVVRRVLTNAGEPVADTASRLAPHRRGVLAFSIAVGTQLTRRHRGEKLSEVEAYIGPAGGGGALIYASFAEFGTEDTPAFAYMRGSWAAHQEGTLRMIIRGLQTEVRVAADRAARRAVRRIA